MFEDSLFESVGRIRTRSRRYAVGTTLLEAALVGVVVIIPYLYPSALPPRLLSVPLISPPPTAPPAPPQTASATAVRPVNLATMLTAPRRIPTTIALVAIRAPEPLGPVGIGQENGNAVSIPWIGPSSPPPLPQVHLAKSSGPLRLSSGVAAGQLLAPIRPRYPAIALAANVQGTVVVAATISTTGRIENLRVLGGPPLLVRAAVDAIREARYRPFLLNGQPVKVETTINVQFVLGQ
jgi:periplasmic protein TonB